MMNLKIYKDITETPEYAEIQHSANNHVHDHMQHHGWDKRNCYMSPIKDLIWLAEVVTDLGV